MTGNHNSGRKPMPSEWRVLTGKGDYKPRGTIKACDNPVAPTDEPQMPEGISEEAQFKWLETTELMKQMGTLSVAYSDLLLLYVETWDTYCRANKMLRKVGLVYVNTESKAAKASPYNLIARQCQQNLVRMQTELGLTPAAKSRLVVPTRKEVSARNRKA
jgi:P27 family predicted phage terminase small subunit